MRFWLGPPDYPTGVIGVIDLRSSPQRVAATPTGLCLYVTANATTLPSQYTNLGTDPERLLTEQQKRAWESALALPNMLVSNTLERIVYETLTTQADPAGLDRPYPLMPTVHRRFEVWLAGAKVSDRAWSFVAPEFDIARDTLKRVYRQMRADSLEGRTPLSLYRKWLGFQVRKYRLIDNQYRALQPEDLPDETPLDPETTRTDDFNRTDNADMSVGAPFTWTDTVNGLRITGNQVVVDSAGSIGRARADSDLSGSDHYVQVVTNGTGTSSARFQGPIARYASASETGYCLQLFGDGNLRMGTLTALGENPIGVGTSQTRSNPDTIKLECNGSTITAYFNGASVESITDTAVTSGTRGGLWMNGSSGGNAAVDDFEAADLGAAAFTLAAEAGAFTLSGTPATLRAGRKLSAAAGSYDWTGQAATLRAARRLSAGGGSYALTGTPATLRLARMLAAGSGAYSLTGSPAGLRAARRITAEAGAYVWTGTDAELEVEAATVVLGARKNIVGSDGARRNVIGSDGRRRSVFGNPRA